MSYTLLIENCASVNVHLWIGVRTFGPCSFMHPGSRSLDLPVGGSLAEAADGFAPACPGSYSVTVIVYFHHVAMDRDLGSFKVDGAAPHASGGLG